MLIRAIERNVKNRIKCASCDCLSFFSLYLKLNSTAIYAAKCALYAGNRVIRKQLTYNRTTKIIYFIKKYDRELAFTLINKIKQKSTIKSKFGVIVFYAGCSCRDTSINM